MPQAPAEEHGGSDVVGETEIRVPNRHAGVVECVRMEEIEQTVGGQCGDHQPEAPFEPHHRQSDESGAHREFHDQHGGRVSHDRKQ